MNAIETLREYVANSGYMTKMMSDGNLSLVPMPAPDAALAAVETLLEAAKARLEGGHESDCPIVVLIAPGGLIQDPTIACDCGYDALAAAVRRVETGQ